MRVVVVGLGAMGLPAAAELARRGFAMRNGSPWTQTAVFQLLPRLVEVGPSIYSSAQWAELRRQRKPPLLRVVGG